LNRFAEKPIFPPLAAGPPDPSGGQDAFQRHEKLPQKFMPNVNVFLSNRVLEPGTQIVILS
jgi:hypothetical protein